MNITDEDREKFENVINEEYIMKLLENKGIKVDVNDIIIEDEGIDYLGYSEFRIDGLIKIHKDNLQ